MRWIVLALSLGAAIVSAIHGVFAMAPLLNGQAAAADFTWTTVILLFGSAVLSLTGGLLAFTRRRFGGILLVAAALICFFAHPSVRYYGIPLLLAGALAFFVKSRSEYEYDDDLDYDSDEDEEDSGYGDDEEDEYGEEYARGGRAGAVQRGVARRGRIHETRETDEPPYAVRHRERPSKIRPDREEYSLSAAAEKNSFDVPHRVRKTKVCTTCGASVGIEHKYCHTCGALLHVAPAAQDSIPPVTAVTASVSQAAETLKDELWPDENYEKADKSAAVPENYAESFELEEDDLSVKEDPYEEAVTDRADRVDKAEKKGQRRVFVTPESERERENEDVFKAPAAVNPDNSYQEFSKYTRRRKRRRISMARRVLGPLVLLLAVAGAGWLLFGGIRQVPAPTPPEPDPIPASQDIEFIPIAPEPTIWERLQIENPARGVVTGSNVNVRQNHSTATQVVTRLNAGVRADVADRWEGVSGTLSGPWFLIRSGGREGWIFGDYFQPLDRRTTTLPEGYTDALLKSFGGGRDELIAQMGNPTRQTATGMTWTGLTADARQESGVTRLVLTGAQHVLQNEVAVGMDEDALYRTVGYPSDYRSGQLRYIEGGIGTGERGMSVRLQNKKVQSITVGSIQ